MKKSAIHKARKIADKLTEIEATLTELADVADEAFTDRSQAWQDGDKGDAWAERISQVRDAASAVQDAIDHLGDIAED